MKKETHELSRAHYHIVFPKVINSTRHLSHKGYHGLNKLRKLKEKYVTTLS